MFWSKRRRVEARGVAGGRRAMVPIPLTGGLLSGELRDEDGKPLAGAEVSIFDRGSRRVARSDTDIFGFFAAAVVPGDFRLRVEAGGYQSLHDRVEVEWGSHNPLGQLTMIRDDSLTVPTAGLYEIDPDHSAIRFVARHIAMSRVYGEFRQFAGRIQIAEPFEDSNVEVVIDAASVHTNSAKRDEHLRSADFLDAARFPHLRFVSHKFARTGGNRWLIDGELTLHGMTSDVQLDTTYLGMQEWNGMRAGCTATTELHREHFTVNWQQMLGRGVPVVGSTIQIVLDIQGVLATG
ncbi:YceI family protein [Pseudonocardia sp. GCM10023141]|uniref:YceI family protein n=1 Tax=Pseudonocardia sp. GCM10023141 TaxID=3252653 RepID=UPI003617A3AE